MAIGKGVSPRRQMAMGAKKPLGYGAGTKPLGMKKGGKVPTAKQAKAYEASPKDAAEDRRGALKMKRGGKC